MTLNNLRILARALIPGAKESVISNTVLDLILNNGVRDIAAYTACLKTNKKFTVTADQFEYNLSTVIGNFLVVDKSGLWWNAGTAASTNWEKLNPKTLKTIDKDRPTWRDEDSDDPQDYSIDGDILTLVPTPDTTLASGLWLYYGRVPTNMTTTSHYPFSGSTTEYAHLLVFDDAILAYAKWKILSSLNKKQDEALAVKEYMTIREEKFSLFKRRPDISAYTKLQGQKIR